jgi:tRNA/rRNA methyltransferase
MVSIILMEPEHPGNIGATARVMANFGFKDLILIEPKVDYLCNEAIARSKHGKYILEEAKIIQKKEIEQFETLIATSAKTCSDYNLPRSPILPEELAERLKKIDAEVGIMFGREGTGLTNEEIKMCDFILSIPSYENYPALNLSQAVAIICYELYKAKGTKEIKKKFKPIAKEEKDIILKKFNNIFDSLEFKGEQKKETQKLFWKRLIGKSFLTKREAYIILGFLKKLEGRNKKESDK